MCAINEHTRKLPTLNLNIFQLVILIRLCELLHRCVMLPKFETTRVWSYLLAINMPASERVNVFMAVPTIYMKLVEEYDRIFTKNARIQEYIRTLCMHKIRLVAAMYSLMTHFTYLMLGYS